MRSVWAVARNTLAQAMRMKVAIVVFLLLIILLPLMSVVMGGDGTLLGKLQTFSSYGLGLIGFLLSILTIAISCFTLSNDLKRKHIFLVITKPILRFQLILGKMLGVIILNFVLLTLFSSILYGLVLYIPHMSDAPAEEKLQAKYEFFTSRIGLKPGLDEEVLTQKAIKRFNELKKKNQLPKGMSVSRVMKLLRSQEVMKAKSVAPGRAKQWDFENVNIKNPNDPNSIIFVRYKYEVTTSMPDQEVFGMWRVGDIRQYETGTGMLTTPVYSMERQDAIKTVREFPVPADAVSSDGYLAVAFFNNPSLNRTTIIPEEVEILYKTSSFTENYIRVILLMLVQLVFLSILGVSLSTWLSFPVAILLSLAIFFTGLINSFIMSAIEGLGAFVWILYAFIIKPILWLLPHFDQMYQPGWYIVDGRTLPLSFLLSALAMTLCVKGLLFILAGMFIFNRREIARTVI